MSPAQTGGHAPNLDKFVKSLKGETLEKSVEGLIALVYLGLDISPA